MTSYDTAVLAQLAVVIVGSVVALTGLGVAVHAYVRRARRAAVVHLRGDDDRLQRLEQAVDAIAIEVERISEGQRFLTKLQTEPARDRAISG